MTTTPAVKTDLTLNRIRDRGRWIILLGSYWLEPFKGGEVEGSWGVLGGRGRPRAVWGPQWKVLGALIRSPPCYRACYALKMTIETMLQLPTCFRASDPARDDLPLNGVLAAAPRCNPSSNQKIHHHKPPDCPLYSSLRCKAS